MGLEGGSGEDEVGFALHSEGNDCLRVSCPKVILVLMRL